MRQITPLIFIAAIGCGGSTEIVKPAFVAQGPIVGTLIIGGRTATATAKYVGGSWIVTGPGPSITVPASDVTQASPLRLEWKSGRDVWEFVE